MHSIKQGLREMTLRNAAILATAIFLIYIAFWYYLKDGPFQSKIFSDLSAPIIIALSAYCLLYAARISHKHDKRLYRAWSLLFAAQFSFFLGDAIFSYYDIFSEQSTSYLSHVFYLLFYPLFLAGSLSLPSANFKFSERIKLLLDAGIVLISSILIYWSLFIAPTIEQNLNADPIIMFLAVAYPIGDLILLFALVEMLFKRHKNLGIDPLLLLGLFCANTIFADAIYMGESLSGTYISGGSIDAFYIISYLILGLAGISQVNNLRLHPHNGKLLPSHHYGEITWLLYLPYLCAGFAFIMLIYSYYNPLAVPFSILAVSVGVIIILVIARHVLVLKENAVLYKEAQEEIA